MNKENEANTMNGFTEDEVDYLTDQPLGRLATVGPRGQPHVVPVGFTYHAEDDTIRISGHDFSETKKFKDAETHPKVAFVVDDLASMEPWRPRGIEIRGLAETFREGRDGVGPGQSGSWLEITPKRIVSWGIKGGG